MGAGSMDVSKLCDSFVVWIAPWRLELVRGGRSTPSRSAFTSPRSRTPVEKAPLVLRQLEEERESFPAQFHGLRDPRVDIARIAEQIAGQADGEIAAKLA